MALGGDEPHSHASMGEQRIGGLGCPVDEHLCPCQDLLEREPKLFGIDFDRLEHAVFQGSVTGQGLGDGAQSILIHDDTVGERAPDVYCDAVCQDAPL